MAGMSIAVLYHWRIKTGRQDEFQLAWEDATRAIHEHCGSYGARLHQAEDGVFWSYARWPSEEARQTCFSGSQLSELACFGVMKECVEERFDEVVLEDLSDLIREDKKAHRVPVLTTTRLVLRPLAYSDAERLFPALSDDDNMRYWSRAPLKSVDEVRDYIRWNVDGAGVECFAVCLADAPEEAQGWVVLMDHKPFEAEIGFILRPDAQGQGLASEAALCVLSHAFTTRGLHRVFGDVDPENRGSIALLEKVGMRREGHLRENWTTHLGKRDSYIYGRLATDLVEFEESKT